MPVPAQPVPPLVPTLASLATQVVGDITMPPAASVSSHGGRASPPRAPAARVTRSYSGLPELLHHIPPPGPIPVPGAVPLRHSFRRPTAHYADTETVGQTTNDEKKSPVRSSNTTYVASWPADPAAAGVAAAAAASSPFDQYPQGSVGARLDPTVDEADIECKKAQTTGKNEGRNFLTETFFVSLTILFCARRFSTTNRVVAQHRRPPPSYSRRAHYSFGCRIEW